MISPLFMTFGLYLIGMLIIGFIAYRYTKNLGDYLLGGRSLGPGVAALSAGASDMSGWLLLGLPGAMYVSGINQIWMAIGLVVGAYLNWQFVAGRLRRYTELAHDSLTLPDYLENRFHDKSRVLRVLSALVILVFFTFYTSSGLVSGAKLFESAFGLDYSTGLWVGSFVVIAYTFFGGFLAVSWTDVVQGIMMFIALLVVPYIAMRALGGWSETIQLVGEKDPAFLDVMSNMDGITIVSLMAWGLGYFGQPHIMARFMAIRSSKDIPLARMICMSWMIVALYGAIMTGFVGIGFYGSTPLAEPETIFIRLAQELTNPWVGGCLLAAVLAAIMSTVDSQLLVSSSVLAEDFYKGMWRKDASDKELVWVGRGAVMSIALIAIWLARHPDSSVLGLVAYAWAGFGAAFGPLLLLSLWWPRMTCNGALAGMFVGAATVIFWELGTGGMFEVYELLPGFVLSTLAVVIVSLTDKPPTQAVRDEFAQV